jgi:hypothetical protein
VAAEFRVQPSGHSSSADCQNVDEASLQKAHFSQETPRPPCSDVAHQASGESLVARNGHASDAPDDDVVDIGEGGSSRLPITNEV